MVKDVKIWLFIILGLLILGMITPMVFILIQENKPSGLLTAQYIYPIIAILAIIISILTLGIISLIFTYSKKEYPHALGMPQGSVRALIALSLITSFVIASVFFFTSIKEPSIIHHANIPQEQYLKLDPREYRNLDIDTLPSLPTPTLVYSLDLLMPASEETSDFANQILTIFGTLVIAVSAFYFGSKATEQGSDIASKVFKRAVRDKEIAQNKNVPDNIIQEAIIQNREHWLKKYEGVKDIKQGKKRTDSVTTGVSCIVFVVGRKDNELNINDAIPKVISYKAKDGVSYDIPTDVLEDNTIVDTNFRLGTELPSINEGEVATNDESEIVSDEATDEEKNSEG